MIVTASQYFIVRDRISGGEYLSTRKSRSNANQPAYRWSKTNRNAAKRFVSYDGAQKARQRYGGEIVRCIKVVAGNKKTTFQEVVGSV
jgi:hypothetical protein